MSSQSSILEKSDEVAATSGYTRPVLGKGRKALLLFLFCFAEFMDSFISSALFPAIPALENSSLKIKPNEITWMFSAYSATFAAFLLISGRVSDIYSAKWSFVIGSACVGLFSLGCGLVHDKIGMFILRAFTGIAAAMTVPSALSLIIEWFPEPAEQQQGIALFGGASALGNVLGILIGAFLTQWASWRWIFFLVTCIGVPIAAVSVIAVPPAAPRTVKTNWKRLDVLGVSMITISMILFIYALTSGPSTGWLTANVIAPLIISIFLAAGFFVVEKALPEGMAALPPKTWFYPNFGILAGMALLPFLWWCALFFQLMPVFQDRYHWSPVMTSVRFLPTGIFSALIAGVSSTFVNYINPKWSILGGLVLVFVASMIIPFADTSTKYWSHLFPAFIVGTIGNMIVYTNSNIAIFMNTPPEIAGIVGAVFNTALQLGLALGLAILTSIQQSVDEKRANQGKKLTFAGTAASLWFVLAWVVVTILCLLLFYKIHKQPTPDAETAVTNDDSGSVTTNETSAVSAKERL